MITTKIQKPKESEPDFKPIVDLDAKSPELTSTVPGGVDAESDKENIDFALIPEAYYIGYDVTDCSTSHFDPFGVYDAMTSAPTTNVEVDEMDLMELDISAIEDLNSKAIPINISMEIPQELQVPEVPEVYELDQVPDLRTVTMDPVTVQSTGTPYNLNPNTASPTSGDSGEITSFAALSGSNSNDEHYSYNAMSTDFGDFTNSDSSSKPRYESLFETEEKEEEFEEALVLKEVPIRKGEDEYFNDDQFHLLAEQILHETQETESPTNYVLKQQERYCHISHHHYQPFRRSEASNTKKTNIWREPLSPTMSLAANGGRERKQRQTLAGLLMHGLEPISSQLFSP